LSDRDDRKSQLTFDFDKKPTRPQLRVIQGEGQKRRRPLESRDAVARVLVEAGADLLLRRISPERAEAIEGNVEEILKLFDKVDASSHFVPQLKAALDELEQLLVETREQIAQRRR
jgi:hypothetical protein